MSLSNRFYTSREILRARVRNLVLQAKTKRDNLLALSEYLAVILFVLFFVWGTTWLNIYMGMAILMLVWLTIVSSSRNNDKRFK